MNIKFVRKILLQLIFFVLLSMESRIAVVSVFRHVTLQIRTFKSVLKPSSHTKTIFLTHTKIISTTQKSSLPAWTLTNPVTTTEIIINTSISSQIATKTVSQDVIYLLKYQDSTTIIIPTNTVTIRRKLKLEAETSTVFVTLNTTPVKTAPSILFCYNMV